MIEQDTVRLLRECDKGVKMGISSIDDVYRYVKSESLKRILSECRTDHESLGHDIEDQLMRVGDTGKDPGAFVKSMSWIKTTAMLAMNTSDNTVADLMTDGCNMGIKSLSKYLNQYAAADESSKDVTKKLIKVEENMSHDLRSFL
ncbi:MAG: hypothetical protein IJK58_05330 [Clostridia bacterium]|nr:hypothetical protein [Clostridia bacterium]